MNTEKKERETIEKEKLFFVNFDLDL